MGQRSHCLCKAHLNTQCVLSQLIWAVGCGKALACWRRNILQRELKEMPRDREHVAKEQPVEAMADLFPQTCHTSLVLFLSGVRFDITNLLNI